MNRNEWRNWCCVSISLEAEKLKSVKVHLKGKGPQIEMLLQTAKCCL